MDISGAFIAIGHDPATSLFKGKLDMDIDNYIITKSDSTQTSIKGVFAAGDVKDKTYRVVSPIGVMRAIIKARGVSDYLYHYSDFAITR